MAILLLLFWISVAFIVYTYILFPAIVFLRGLLLHQPYKSADITPTVSLIIAVYNEAKVIGAKLDNILAMDYPSDKLEVIIASDGSTDGTDEIVRQRGHANIKLLSLPRQGKVAALNAAVEASTGEILVFSDANSMYAPDALRAIVRPFADPEVGGVAGDQQYQPNSSKEADNEGERSYWSFDRWLKRSQSKAGHTISATGAIYAVRRSLFRPAPPGCTDDFVISTRVIALGYRLVFAGDAIAYEPVAKSSGVEFGRKVRVLTQSLRSIVEMRELLNPFRYGFYALQLFSHKLMRRLVFLPLIVLLVVNPFLWQEGPFYQLTMLAQIAFYGLALVGWRFSGMGIGRIKLFALPFFVCMVYLAALMATLNILRGRRIERWQPQR